MPRLLRDAMQHPPAALPRLHLGQEPDVPRPGGRGRADHRLMRRRLTTAAVTAAGLAACVAPAQAARPPLSWPRLTASSLVYQGAFRLPAPVDGTRTFEYGGTALAYNPARHSLFAVGHDWYQLTAEVTIPGLRRRAHVGGLRRARFLQPFTDATDGAIDRTGGDDNKIGGQLVYSGRLVGSVYIYYDASGSQVRSHWVRPSTSLTAGTAR